MKRTMMAFALLAVMLLLAGCGGAPREPEAQPAATATVQGQDGRVVLADQPAVDLTLLSGTMAYAELFNMSSNTAQYEGKTVRMKGQYYSARIESTDEVVHLVMVTDQQACCSIGVEFTVTGSPSYPEDYPELYSTIELTGLFGTITVADNVYPLLTVNDIKVLEPPPVASEEY